MTWNENPLSTQVRPVLVERRKRDAPVITLAIDMGPTAETEAFRRALEEAFVVCAITFVSHPGPVTEKRGKALIGHIGWWLRRSRDDARHVRGPDLFPGSVVKPNEVVRRLGWVHGDVHDCPGPEHARGWVQVLHPRPRRVRLLLGGVVIPEKRAEKPAVISDI